VGKSIIEFKPRVKCKEGIIITADGFNIKNKVEFESERYLIPSLKISKAVCCSILSIAGTNLSAYYLSKQLISSFDVRIDSSTPRATSEEILSHDSRCLV